VRFYLCATQWVVRRLPCTASNTSSSSCSLLLLQPTRVFIMNAPLFFFLSCTIANKCLLCCLRSGYRRLYSFNAALTSTSQKQYTKSILKCSAWVNRAISFRCFTTFVSELMWTINQCSMSSFLWRYECPATVTKGKRQSVRLGKSETVANRINLCLHIQFSVSPIEPPTFAVQLWIALFIYMV
jgi:hypothetical protein